MNCVKVQDQLVAYDDGELEVAPRRAVEAHLADCAACNQELDALRRALGQLHGYLEAPPPAERAPARAEEPRPLASPIAPRRWTSWSRAAAVLAFAAFALHLASPPSPARAEDRLSARLAGVRDVTAALRVTYTYAQPQPGDVHRIDVAGTLRACWRSALRCSGTEQWTYVDARGEPIAELGERLRWGVAPGQTWDESERGGHRHLSVREDRRELPLDLIPFHDGPTLLPPSSERAAVELAAMIRGLAGRPRHWFGHAWDYEGIAEGTAARHLYRARVGSERWALALELHADGLPEHIELVRTLCDSHGRAFCEVAFRWTITSTDTGFTPADFAPPND